MSNVIGRRVGGGFEIESIVAAQREDAQRTKMRQEMEAKIKAEQAAHAILSEGSSHALKGSPKKTSPVKRDDGAPEPSHSVARLPLNVPRPKIQKQLADHVAPAEIKDQQRRRQACNALGFPGLWSYSQTRIACEELSRGISDMAFAHGGDKVFPSPNVLQAYKEMHLGCLHDPLLAPMVSRLQLHHERQAAMRGDHHATEDGAGDVDDVTSNRVSTGGDEDDRVGVERFALPPNALTHIDPVRDPPLAIPMLECLETVLAFSKLSTAAERRAIKTAALDRLHHRRSASLYSVLLPECAERVVEKVIHPTTDVPHSDDLPVCDVIQILFWYVYCAFFLHDEVESLARRMFPRLSEALLAVHLNSVALRHHRLASNGEPQDGHASVGVVEHANNQSEPLDFLNFVIVHTVCFLFPVVFPASHDLFTVDFFDRSSILMNLILNGAESDAQYWRCIRKDFFGAPETSIEGIANAAELARSESDRLLQHYQDDVAQLKRMKENLERRVQERSAAILRTLDTPHGPHAGGSADAPSALAHKESIARRQERKTPFITRASSSIYCPPLDSIELGDPEFHLLNDAVFDAEYAQDLIRGRMQQGSAGRSASGVLPAFDPRNREEASRFAEAQARKKYIGHRAVMRVATFLDVKERYHPSAYSVEHRVAQSIMAKDMNTLRQHIAEGGATVPSITASSTDADNPTDQPVGHAGGFVVRFSPLGISCSECAEAMARQYRTICASAVDTTSCDPSVTQRSRSPLHREDPTSDTYLGMQLTLFNGPPVATQAASLMHTDVQSVVRDRRGAPPVHGTSTDTGAVASIGRDSTHRRRLSDAISIDSIEDPTIEDIPSPTMTSRTSPRFGEVLFGKRVKSMVSIKPPSQRDEYEDDARVAAVDEEALCAVTDLSGAMFPREMTRPYDIDDSNDRIVPGLEEASHVSAVGRGKQVGALDETAVVEKERDAPLALKSFLSFKRHESVAYSAARPLRHMSTSKPSGLKLQRSGGSLMGTSTVMTPKQRSSTPSEAAERKRSSTIMLTTHRPRPNSSASVLPPPGRASHGRSATPSSRPNGTLVSSLNVVAGSPSNGAVAPSQAAHSNGQWLSMTNTVIRTQKFIDDAVRIHNAQRDIKQMVQDQFERRRSTTDLRQRAMDKTFEDEMGHLATRMEDPLQRTMLVNDWIAREPARRNPDRDKHAAMLRGTLLAEEAQHTSLLVREGLKNLELTFARRRRQSRKMR